MHNVGLLKLHPTHSFVLITHIIANVTFLIRVSRLPHSDTKPRPENLIIYLCSIFGQNRLLDGEFLGFFYQNISLQRTTAGSDVLIHMMILCLNFVSSGSPGSEGPANSPPRV